MSEKNDPNETALEKFFEGVESDPWCDPAFRRKEQLSGWMKGIGVLILWFGFWGILSII
jgi:hypothetical protein